MASGGAPDIQATNKYLEVHHEQLKPVKKQEKVIIPIKEHPKVCTKHCLKCSELKQFKFTLY